MIDNSMIIINYWCIYFLSSVLLFYNNYCISYLKPLHLSGPPEISYPPYLKFNKLLYKCRNYFWRKNILIKNINFLFL
jgi:hypothetical protein